MGLYQFNGPNIWMMFPRICYLHNGQGNSFMMQVWACHCFVQLSMASANAIQNLCPGAQGQHLAFSPDSLLTSFLFCSRHTDCLLFLEHVKHPHTFPHLILLFLEYSSLCTSSNFVLYHQTGVFYPHYLSNNSMFPTFSPFISLDFFPPFSYISVPDIMLCIV